MTTKSILPCVTVALAICMKPSGPLLAATHFIGDGGDLFGIVAAASSGDLIEIQSDGVFVGTLTWQHKYLTVKAATGFSPTIRGNNEPAVQNIYGVNGTGGHFQGLRLESGLNPSSVNLGATSNNFTSVTFVDSEFLTRVTVSGTGSYNANVSIYNSRFHRRLDVGGTGNAQFSLTVDGSRLDEGIFAGGAGGRTSLIANGNYLGASFITNNERSDVLATNNVIEYTGVGTEPYGIVSTGGPDGAGVRFVNNTVVNFPVGIYAPATSPTRFENMLLRNTKDISNEAPAPGIVNSLIADGTYAGVSGNFAASPLFDAEFKLLSGSPGIDAGNNAALNLPAKDFDGRNRVIDGNGDGIARVDVGAFEAIPEPGSWALCATAIAQLTLRRRRGGRRTSNRFLEATQS